MVKDLGATSDLMILYIGSKVRHNTAVNIVPLVIDRRAPVC